MKRAAKKLKPRTERTLTAADAIAHQMTAEAALKERKAAAKEADLRAQVKALSDRLNDAEARAEFVSELKTASAVEPPKARAGRVLGTDKRHACAVAIASDWHVEERVDPDTVNGLNQYNPDIAEHRSRRFFEGVEWLIREQQSLFTIKRLVLGLLGDMITGFIHDELQEGNYMSPSYAVVFAKGLIEAGIKGLLKSDPDLQIHVVCKHGNHGRTTKKLKIGTATENSFEWLLYQMLASEFSDEPRVTWQIDKGHHSVTPVFGMRMHTHHGDSVRSNGGIGGVQVPLTRAAVRWRETFEADFSVVGHFHNYTPGQRVMINGSLIGYSHYCQFLPGATPEPAQQLFFLIDSKRGICQQTPVWCQDS